MSLAMFAAPIDDNSNITLPNNSDNSDNIINQKRHKRTQRKYPKIENFDTDKVNSVLQKIHNSNEEDDDVDAFNPPPKPESMGVLKTIPNQNWSSNSRDIQYEEKNTQKTESFGGMNFPLGNNYVGRAPMPNYENTDNLDLNDYSNYGDMKSAEEYYKKVLPGYKNQINRPYYNLNQNYQNYQNELSSQDILIKKLNYMISLLEDKQDEKTNNVTEEVILYSFLGIFIIFIADTFVRAGKYVR
jgi:hypothetical protein